MVHSDFHYAKAMLFSARRLWYYIPLSLHHFQRLPFLLIRLNRMLKTSRACFWTCLTLLLWSHIHSHTYLLRFSNLAISCGCPALSIWVFVVIYASHLSDASNPWVIFLLKAHLCSSSHRPSWRAGTSATLPFHLLGVRPRAALWCLPHCTALVELSWLLYLYNFIRPGGFSRLHQVSRDPSSGWCVHAQPSGHDAFPRCLPPTKLPCCPVRHFTTDSWLQNSPSSWFPPLLCPKGVWGGWWALTWRHMWLSPARHTRIMEHLWLRVQGVIYLLVAPHGFSQSGQHPSTFLWLKSASKASFVKVGVFWAAF